MFTFCRYSLLNSVQVILAKYNLTHLMDNVDIYLYGHSKFSATDNSCIILAIIKFINETGRFL